MNRKKEYPSIIQTFLLIPLFILTSMLLEMLSLFVFMYFNPGAPFSRTVEMSNNMIYTSLLSVAVDCALICFVFKRSKLKANEAFPLKKVNAALFLYVAITTLGLQIMLSDLGNMVQKVKPMSDFLYNLFRDNFSGENNYMVTVISTVICAPVLEELLCRGVIYKGLKKNYSVKASIFVSSLFFGVLHMNIYQGIGAFFIGLFLAWLVERTGSLIPCMFAHAFNNGFPYVLDALNIRIIGFNVDVGNKAVMQPMWFDVCGLVLFLGGLYLIRQHFGGLRAEDKCNFHCE